MGGPKSPRMHLLLELLHLAAWAQAGVVVRIYLGKLFGAACDPQVVAATSPSRLPCVTSRASALFVDLPANVAGSWVIGLLSAGDALATALPWQAQAAKGLHVAALPQASALQGYPQLWLGLRTGFCGSLTTFASWMLQMVVMLVGGAPSPTGTTQWVASLCGCVLGSACALTALVAGQHTALTACHWFQARAAAARASAAGELRASVSLEKRSAELEAGEPAPELDLVRADAEAAAAGAAEGSAGVVGDEEAGAATAAAANGSAAPDAARAGAGGGGASSAPVQVPTLSVQVAATPNAAAGAKAGPGAGRQAGSIAGDGSWAERPVSHWCADAAALATLCLLTTLSLVYGVRDTAGSTLTHAQQPRNFIWFSVLFAPFGCWARWRLAVFNGTVTAWDLGWLPAGTLAANLLACVLDFVCQALSVRLDSLSQLQWAMLTAAISGFGGCLSTVSTWVMEVQKLLLRLPASWKGYYYLIGSQAAALVLGIIIYGTSVWTM